MTTSHGDQAPQMPLWALLTQDSTREEVLAALAEQDERDRLFAELPNPVFPGMPEDPNERRGCYWSDDGNVVACYRSGPRDEPEHLRRQRAAGEEDQDDGTWAIG